jgi:hypothetical protein
MDRVRKLNISENNSFSSSFNELNSMGKRITSVSIHRYICAKTWNLLTVHRRAMIAYIWLEFVMLLWRYPWAKPISVSVLIFILQHNAPSRDVDVTENVSQWQFLVSALSTWAECHRFRPCCETGCFEVNMLSSKYRLASSLQAFKLLSRVSD